MPNKHRFTLTTLTLLTVLAMSAMWAAPARADDSTPPPVETPTEVAPPSAEEPAAESPAPVAELLEQLPEGTEVVVVNSAGEEIPLASQEAAAAIDIVDPMWCPTGVTPGGAGCSIDYGSLNLLVADVGVGFNPNKSGTIWIEATPNETSASAIIFDKDTNGAFLIWSAFDLTFQGGWSGGLNKTINTATPSVISQRLFIDWTGSITLNDLVISATAADATNRNALEINTFKNITLERVTVQDADNTNLTGVYNGAVLNNNIVGSVGNVTINNSNFQGNEGIGLQVFSRGLITTNNLTANNNNGDGAILNNSQAVTDKAVFMKGLKQFNNNGGDGLNIFSRGLVTISTVVANKNGGSGVLVDNRLSVTLQGVTIGGTNSFVFNGSNGITVYSHGAITAANFTVTDNGDNGALLDNCDDDGGSTCQLSVAKPVTISGVNSFKNNSLTGLTVLSYGAITVSSLTASYNVNSGAYLNNSWLNLAAIPAESKGTITLKTYATFEGNSDSGLEAYSHGNILIANLTANRNDETLDGFDGAHLEASRTVGSASITLTGLNSFSHNGLDGLYVDSDGKITVSSISAFFNGGDGAQLLTSDIGMGVTLTGTNNFMYNGDFGLDILSAGAITAANLNANFNTNQGASLQNDADILKPYNVTLSGTNSFSVNGDGGLVVFSFGTILVNNLSANENGYGNSQGDGALLDNSGANLAAPKAVTVTGFLNVNTNFSNGLYINSLGAITLSNVSADGNGEEGAEIINSNNALKPQNVTLKGSNSFSSNGTNGAESDGLIVSSYGAIALNNITANYNGGDGAQLDNSLTNTYITAKTITLTGVNSFVGNSRDGLSFDASGAVVLNRVNADFNDGVVNAYAGSGILGSSNGSITLVCGHTSLNEGYGYNLSAVGLITIKGIYSAYNNEPAADFVTAPNLITKACALP